MAIQIQRSQNSLGNILSTVQISSLGFSDTPFKVGYLQIFSVIRRLSPTTKSEERVFYEIVGTSMVYILQFTAQNFGFAMHLQIL